MPARDGSGHFGKLNKQLWRGVDPVMIRNIRLYGFVSTSDRIQRRHILTRLVQYDRYNKIKRMFI